MNIFRYKNINIDRNFLKIENIIKMTKKCEKF